MSPEGRSVTALIVAAAALRIAFGAALGLGVDESYMVASGRVLSLGYYDHPPIAWWLSWGAAHLFGSEAAVLVRLPFVLLFALSTWLMYRLGAAVADARAGLWAALLLNLSPVFGVTTGSWVLPDGPLDCALLAAALCLVRALERGTLAWWLGTGLCAGLALLAKYSAILTMAGAACYLLTSRVHRRWLVTAKPWLAALVALLMFAPVLLWNAAHGWVSIGFQAGRAEGGWQVRPFAPLATLAGEALFVLPWIWLPMMAVFIVALRRGPDQWPSWLLACLAAPPILLFALVSAWARQRVLFHWAAPGYLMLFPLLGEAVARRSGMPAVRYLTAGTAAFVVLAVAVVATQVRLDWMPARATALTGRDADLDAIDWTSLRDQLATRGLLAPDTIVAVPNWRDAGKVGYALGPGTTTLCLSADPRQFGIAWPPAGYLGEDMLLVAPDHAERVAAELGPSFERLEALPGASIRLRGRTLQDVALFHARHLRGWPPPA